MKKEPARKPARKAAKEAPKSKAARAAVDAANGKARGTRKSREGLVVSNRMTKTVVVAVDRRMQHALYAKTVTRSQKFKVHDEMSCDVGDRVLIVETRPMSREKRWRVARILEKVK